MELHEAIEIAVAARHHPRYRDLCSEDHPDHEYWRREVFRIAGVPVAEPESASKPLPPIVVQASNLAGTIARTIVQASRGEPVIVPEGAAQARLAVCEGCPSLRDDRRCSECGCFVPAAVHVAAKDCPLGKWPSLGG